jgi:hypothetical protein
MSVWLSRFRERRSQVYEMINYYQFHKVTTNINSCFQCGSVLPLDRNNKDQFAVMQSINAIKGSEEKIMKAAADVSYETKNNENNNKNENK